MIILKGEHLGKEFLTSDKIRSALQRKDLPRRNFIRWRTMMKNRFSYCVDTSKFQCGVSNYKFCSLCHIKVCRVNIIRRKKENKY